MSTTYEITGTGPLQTNGSMQVFTISSNVYIATAANITALGRNPLPGDQLTDNGNGTITLIANPGSVVADAPNIDPVDDGGTDIGGGMVQV